MDDFDLILLGENGSTAEISDDEDSESDIQSSKQNSRGKGDAAAWLARMEGTKTMAKKIAGEHEKKKFWEEYKNYQSIGEYGIRDWSSMATAWNLFVCERERRKENDVVKYYRKQGHMLGAFFDSGGKSNNIKATLQPHIRSIDNLIKEHRTPVIAPSTSFDALSPKATHGPSSGAIQNNDFSQMVPFVPLHMSYATILTDQKSGPIIYPGQLEQAQEKNGKKDNSTVPFNYALHVVTSDNIIEFTMKNMSLNVLFKKMLIVMIDRLKVGVHVQSARREQQK